MFKCSIGSLNSVFAKISENASLYLPADNSEGKAVYTKWENGIEWSNSLNTVKSPKDFFFPQMEDLMAFKVEGKNIEVKDIRNESEDFVVFGVRACDVKSFDILDRVFLTEPADSFYANRRNHGVIVSLACTRPVETCFCKTFGIDPSAPAGDISAWKTESDIFFEANTEKGKALLHTLSELTEECDDGAVAEQKAKINTVKDIRLRKNIES